ncbi:(d)CMP kinase [Aquihabitans daechungensis]|uniref:(d)CMP kinase n=1 Tax=Aquihabitans daechungensis TaxID=1052257 RepID=UPI003B9DDE50
MLITLSGLPGSGTSTVARAVAARLGLDHLDGGTVFRAMASERSVSLAEFAQIAEGDDSIDRALDDRLVERARDGDVLLESRLAGWLATRAALRALRVWIHCDEVERARRVGARDGHDADEALATNQQREASERTRYLGFYDIDLQDLSIYDLVVDSTSTPPDAIIDQIVAAAAASSA